MGIEQVKMLNKTREGYAQVLDNVAADGKYGNAQFLRPLQGQLSGVVVRMRKDRVLYRAPEQPKKRKRGRPNVHGKRLTRFFKSMKFG